MNAAAPRVHTLPAFRFRLAQRKHFVWSVALPVVASLALPFVLPVMHHAGLALAIWAATWFLVGGVGVSVGLHRHFSHRSFEARPGLRVALGVLGGMAAQGPLVYWVSVHRMHHACSDQPGDPHSPRLSAWPDKTKLGAALHGHVGWVWEHDVPKPTRYARDLLGDAIARRVNSAYPFCVLGGLVLPALASCAALRGAVSTWDALAFGAYWGGAVRIAVGHQIIWAINSWCHLRGGRATDTPECSTNVAWLSLVSWGESWHNNHHARPTDPRFGRGLREPDIGWWLVRLFIRLNWATSRSPRLRGDSDGGARPG